MIPFLAPGGFVRYLGADGEILPFGKLYFYDTQTLIEANVYDEDGDVLAQPITADITGLFQQPYLDEQTTYRVRIETALGVEVFDIDPYPGSLTSVGYLTFEQFGAVGSGTADDSAAISEAIAASLSTGLPIVGRSAATYGVGSSGWSGLAFTLTRNLQIYGNGATIKTLFLPSQTVAAGSSPCVFKFDGTASLFQLNITNLNFNLNLIKAFAFSIDRCIFSVTENYAYGGNIGAGGIGDTSGLVYATRSQGYCSRNRSKNCPFLIYAGHTNTGFGCTNVFVQDNVGSEFYKSGTPGIQGDPVNGVMTGGRISGNIWDGFFEVGFSAVAAQGTFCSNIEVDNNILSNFTGNAIGTDVIGAIFNTGFNIHDNIINDAVGTARALYLLHLNDSSASDNRGVNLNVAIEVDDSTNLKLLGNDFKRGTASATNSVGVYVVGSAGLVTRLKILGNSMQDFDKNFYLGAAGACSYVTLTGGNTAKGGANGLFITDPVTNVFVDGNDFDGGASTFDINNQATNGQAGVQFGYNKFASASGVAQVLPVAAPAPTAKTADATLTIAELLTGIIKVTSATAVALTLPTGTLTAGGLGTFAIGQAFDWSVINLGSASGAVTMTSGTDHTYEGSVIAIGSSALLRTRKTAATTMITYRIG